MKLRYPIPAVLLLASAAHAQTESALDRILARLDKMEQDNRKLSDEVRSLRDELAILKTPPVSGSEPVTGSPPLQERIAVQEARADEMSQSKVESSQKSPVAITGMLLFNAFRNGKNAGTSQYPVVAAFNSGPTSSGASLRQTVLGLTFNGPSLPWGGKATGSVYMDFFAGSALPEDHIFHLRVATLDLNWRNTTIMVGQDKPIVAPREPDSLAQVGVSPLTAAGNLWDWQPQARIEQRFRLGENSGLRAQAGIYQTQELDANVPAAYARTLERARPGYEGRVEFWHKAGVKRFEFAPGYHRSTTHVAGTSVDSRVFTFDGLLRPVQMVEITGALFRGQNVANLGALRQGFLILGPSQARAVHSTGGWAQIAIFPTPKLTFHLYGGQQSNRAADLLASSARRNFVYAGNLMYRLAPNILGSIEISQTRTDYLTQRIRLNNHYDLALAYLF